MTPKKRFGPLVVHSGKKDGDELKPEEEVKEK
jgi:hypothetical protein